MEVYEAVAGQPAHLGAEYVRNEEVQGERTNKKKKI
jgi:hypothetical protein